MAITSSLIGLALWLLPRAFRRRFGGELGYAARRLAARARAEGGRRAAVACLARELAALLRLAIDLRRTRDNLPARRKAALMLDGILDDLRWSLRHARRRPAFTAAVTTTLAVAIAAAATAYGLATAVLWRPLPFDDAGRLVFVWEDGGAAERPSMRVTAGRYESWRESGVLPDIALFGAAGFTIEDADGASSVRGVRVSARYFDTLGVRAAIGRTFTEAEEAPGQDRLVILSDALWRQRFGGRSGVLGETVRLSGAPYTIVGVMPPLVFPGWPVNPATVTIDPEAIQLWVPILRTPQLLQNHRSHVFGVVARLPPGLTPEQAAERLDRSTREAVDRHGARLTPLRDQFVRDARLPLLLLIGSALAVLLVACANLAAMHASVFEGRREELGMRAALGATRPRLARQVATESLVVSVAAGALGVLLTRAALAAVPGLLPPTVPFLTLPALDLRVGAFGVALAIAAGLVVAAWPIRQLASASLMWRERAAVGRARVYRALVVAQIAVTVALVTAAGLLSQSLRSVRAVDPGFVVDGVLVADIGLPPAEYREAAAPVGFEDRFVAALESQPGVAGVALAYDHPLEANWTDAYRLSGEVAEAGADSSGQAELRIVSPGYFDALGVEILDGRAFGHRDDLERPGVAVVNEAFARAAGGRVIGRSLRTSSARFTWGEAAQVDFRIVGVVENERSRGLEIPVGPAMYLSTRQFPQHGVTMLLRTGRDPLAFAAGVRAALRAAEPGATLSAPRELSSILADQLVARRVTTGVIGWFALAALALAALGLYGLLAMHVAGRTREIGVRLAIGASPAVVARQVVGESLVNAALGVALGAALALATGRALRGLLVGVSARDPITLGVVALVLLAVATLAALFPARRAALVDPMCALRAE
jgi:putative ABC transport system permease protein